MIALCLDTNTYSAYRRNDQDASQLLSWVDQVWVPATVLGELRAGFLKGNRNAANELMLAEFLASPHVSVAPVTEATSRYFALVSHQLGRTGKPIPANDMWIAASAIEHQCPLFTLDAHFQAVTNLTVVDSCAQWITLQH